CPFCLSAALVLYSALFVCAAPPSRPSFPTRRSSDLPPALAGRGRRRVPGARVRDRGAVPARPPDRVHEPVGRPRRVGLSGGPGPDRDRLGRLLWPRPRRFRPEDLLPSRGPHRLHPRPHLRGTQPWREPPPHRSFRAVCVHPPA